MFQQDNIVTGVTWSGLQKLWQQLMAARIKVVNIFYCHLIVNHILQSKSGWLNNSTTVSHLFFLISTSIFWSVGTWTCPWVSVSVHPNFYLGCFNCTIELRLKSKLSLVMMKMVLFLIILCCALLFNIWDQLGNNTAITMSSLLIILRIKLPVLVTLGLLTLCWYSMLLCMIIITWMLRFTGGLYLKLLPYGTEYVFGDLS